MNTLPSQEVAGHCLQASTQLVPASLAAFYCIDRNLQARDLQLQGMSNTMHREYLDHYRQLDPLQPSLCLSRGLSVAPLKLAMAYQATRDNQRYWHFLQRHGIVDVVETLAHRTGQPQAAISLLRTVEPGGGRSPPINSPVSTPCSHYCKWRPPICSPAIASWLN